MEGTTVENLPRRIGRFEIAARIAGGASPIGSEVFIATDSLRGSGKAVVVKRLATSLAKHDAKVGVYVATAQDVARKVHHPNIVEIRTVGNEAKDVFLVMDYVPGETLARFLRELHKTGKTLPSSLAAYVVAEACAGLDAAHRSGFVHGLLTPYDVFLGYDGSVKVLDIGIASARAVAAGDGDVAQVRDIEVQYSSPEVCRGETADRRSDVFSLGAILWELLTGVAPFDRSERAAIIRAICDEALASPDSLRRDGEYPGRLSATTMEALEREPTKRCADAGKLRQLLLGHVGADKPARNELAALMKATFEKRKMDKETLVASVAKKAPASALAALDFVDGPSDEELHPADLDAKIPSGISTSAPGSVTAGPKVVVHRPQSDPSIRNQHQNPARERKATAPLVAKVASIPPPVPSTPRSKHPAAINGAPVPIAPAEFQQPDGCAAAKPPHVPFYDDSTEARQKRQEPTSVIVRPKAKSSATLDSDAPPAKKKSPVAAILMAVIGFAITLGIIFFVTRKPEVTAKPSPSTSVAAAAVSAPPAVSSSPPPIEMTPPSATPSASASASTPAVADKTVLSIDTVPTHATISLNGKKVGSSPIELKVPKGSDEVTVEIQHPGYVTLKERVVPDVNQRMKLNLVPAKTTGGTAPKPASTNPYRKFE